MLSYLVIVFTALTLCLKLFAINVIDDHRKIINYDTMLARWMVHINWRGTLYVDSKEQDPVTLLLSYLALKNQHQLGITSTYFEGCSTNSSGNIYIYSDNVHNDRTQLLLHQVAVTFVIDTPKSSVSCFDADDTYYHPACTILFLKGIFVNATTETLQRDVECIKKAIGQSSSSSSTGEHYMLSISEVQLVHSMTGYMRRVDVDDYFSVEKVDDEIHAIMEDELVRDAADIYDDDHDDHLDDDDAMDMYDRYGEPFNLFDQLYDTDDDYLLEAYRTHKLKLMHSRYDDAWAYYDGDDDDAWAFYDGDDNVGAYPDDDSQDELDDSIADDDIYWN